MLDFIYARGIGDWERHFAHHLADLMALAKYLRLHGLQDVVHRLRAVNETFTEFCRRLSHLEECVIRSLLSCC